MGGVPCGQLVPDSFEKFGVSNGNGGDTVGDGSEFSPLDGVGEE
jgi:hypothetical protein